MLDRLTITIKQNVMFQRRIHIENVKLDRIKNGRQSTIIYLNKPDIG